MINQQVNKNTILNSKSSSLLLIRYYINDIYFLLQLILQIQVLSLPKKSALR